MTVNKILEAIASKLIEIWPDRNVFVDKIPKGADGNFFVGVIETSQEKKLDRRRTRSCQIEVLYFLKSDDNMAFNDWADTMYDNFETLDVEEGANKTRRLYLTGQTARKDESGVFQFLFYVNINFVMAPEAIEFMENLTQKEGLK
jgi:transcription termination factor NusB